VKSIEPSHREIPIDIAAVLAAMKQLDSDEDTVSKMIFWFDN